MRIKCVYNANYSPPGLAEGSLAAELSGDHSNKCVHSCEERAVHISSLAVICGDALVSFRGKLEPGGSPLVASSSVSSVSCWHWNSQVFNLGVRVAGRSPWDALFSMVIPGQMVSMDARGLLCSRMFLSILFTGVVVLDFGSLFKFKASFKFEYPTKIFVGRAGCLPGTAWSHPYPPTFLKN